MAQVLQEKKSLYAFDEEFLKTAPILCGVDEAGRGPLCGPVSVAAVILDPENPIDGVNDSKKLTEKKREALYPEIMEKALAWHVELVHADEIDELNILQATMVGMQRAVAGLGKIPQLILVDGNKTPDFGTIPSRAVTKGDATSACIAAASVIAKVTRDNYMRALDEQFPQYKLAQHKGYPTKLHYELLREHGVQPFYRKSFLKKSGLV